MITDTLFNRIFADPGNTEMLADFLDSILDIPKQEYKEIASATLEPFRWYGANPLGILYVSITTPIGCSIDVEITLKSFPGKELGAVIIITDDLISPEYDGYHSVYCFMNTVTKELLSDAVRTHMLELVKVSSEQDLPGDLREDKLKRWLLFLKAETREELETLSKRIAHLDEPMLKKAIGIAMGEFTKE
ncbi:MAG: Rpn family recombination-promoting nuclease/putative transposase [Spirochaetaceae bacterium]|jgi:hypothetical protein|nr:Rpn family recombination-promoting nuclease/putative transposase [Spirochaetaceae bacterium]